MLGTVTVFVFAALVGSPQPSNTWAPSELRDASRYDLLQETDRVFGVKRRSDGVVLYLDATSSSPQAASRPIRTNAIGEPLETVPFSGMPFGRQLICPRRPGNVAIDTLANYDGVRLSMSSPALRNGRSVRNRPDDLAAEGRWAEAIARKAFAAYASRRLGPAETIAVNGRSVASRRAERSNAEMADLEGWASAVGASLTRDPNGDAWTLVRGGVSRLFALGADKVKAGGVWKPMADAPMLKDGRVFVPRDGLSN